jgi:hypothetical protein
MIDFEMAERVTSNVDDSKAMLRITGLAGVLSVIRHRHLQLWQESQASKWPDPGLRCPSLGFWLCDRTGAGVRTFRGPIPVRVMRARCSGLRKRSCARTHSRNWNDYQLRLWAWRPTGLFWEPLYPQAALGEFRRRACSHASSSGAGSAVAGW